MTEDKRGQAQSTGYAVREMAPDSVSGGTEPEQAAPMTRLQKAASALHGDRSDQAATTSHPETPETPEVPGAPGPNESWVTRSPEPAAVSRAEYADATLPQEVGIVRRPDAGSRDYWNEDARETGPYQGARVTNLDARATGTGTAPLVPGSQPGVMAGRMGPGSGDPPDPSSTQPDIYGTAARIDTGTASGPFRGTAARPTPPRDPAFRPTPRPATATGPTPLPSRGA